MLLASQSLPQSHKTKQPPPPRLPRALAQALFWPASSVLHHRLSQRSHAHSANVSRQIDRRLHHQPPALPLISALPPPHTTTTHRHHNLRDLLPTISHRLCQAPQLRSLPTICSHSCSFCPFPLITIPDIAIHTVALGSHFRFNIAFTPALLPSPEDRQQRCCPSLPKASTSSPLRLPLQIILTTQRIASSSLSPSTTKSYPNYRPPAETASPSLLAIML